MPRGYRLVIVAIGVSLAFAIWLWVSLQPQQPRLFVQQRQPNTSEYHAGGKACQPPVLAAIRDGRKRASRAERCAKEAEEYRQQSEDLVQQTRAASAAEAQTHLAFEQNRLGVYQTIGGFLTLVAAVAAAAYAREAAYETKRSANLTSESVRPHLLPSVITYGPPDRMWDKPTLPFNITIKNFGTVPGFVTRYRIAVVVCPAPLPAVRLDDKDWLPVFWPITDTLSFGHGNARCILEQGQVDLFEAGAAKIFMIIEFDYTNGADRSFSTRAVWESMPHGHPPQAASSGLWKYT